MTDYQLFNLDLFDLLRQCNLEEEGANAKLKDHCFDCSIPKKREQTEVGQHPTCAALLQSAAASSFNFLFDAWLELNWQRRKL